MQVALKVKPAGRVNTVQHNIIKNCLEKKWAEMEKYWVWNVKRWLDHNWTARRKMVLIRAISMCIHVRNMYLLPCCTYVCVIMQLKLYLYLQNRSEWSVWSCMCMKTTKKRNKAEEIKKMNLKTQIKTKKDNHRHRCGIKNWVLMLSVFSLVYNVQLTDETKASLDCQ